MRMSRDYRLGHVALILLLPIVMASWPISTMSSLPEYPSTDSQSATAPASPEGEYLSPGTAYITSNGPDVGSAYDGQEEEEKTMSEDADTIVINEKQEVEQEMVTDDVDSSPVYEEQEGEGGTMIEHGNVGPLNDDQEEKQGEEQEMTEGVDSSPAYEEREGEEGTMIEDGDVAPPSDDQEEKQGEEHETVTDDVDSSPAYEEQEGEEGTMIEDGSVAPLSDDQGGKDGEEQEMTEDVDSSVVYGGETMPEYVGASLVYDAQEREKKDEKQAMAEDDNVSPLIDGQEVKEGEEQEKTAEDSEEMLVNDDQGGETVGEDSGASLVTDDAPEKDDRNSEGKGPQSSDDKVAAGNGVPTRGKQVEILKTIEGDGKERILVLDLDVESRNGAQESGGDEMQFKVQENTGVPDMPLQSDPDNTKDYLRRMGRLFKKARLSISEDDEREGYGHPTVAEQEGRLLPVDLSSGERATCSMVWVPAATFIVMMMTTGATGVGDLL